MRNHVRQRLILRFGGTAMSRARFVFSTALLFCMWSVVQPAYAQGDSPEGTSWTVWVSLGLGGGSEGFAGSLESAVQVNRHLLSLRSAIVANIFDDGFWDFAVLYGRATRWPRGQAAASIGLAIVDGERCAGLSGCTPVSAVLGFPIAAQVFWRPMVVVGVGLYGFANLNSEQSFAGVTLSLQFGKLR